MAEYHVGAGAFGIYAGTLEPRNRNLWRNKSDVTDEALAAVAQFLIVSGTEYYFMYKGGKYRMTIAEVEKDG